MVRLPFPKSPAASSSKPMAASCCLERVEESGTLGRCRAALLTSGTAKEDAGSSCGFDSNKFCRPSASTSIVFSAAELSPYDFAAAPPFSPPPETSFAIFALGGAVARESSLEDKVSAPFCVPPHISGAPDKVASSSDSLRLKGGGRSAGFKQEIISVEIAAKEAKTASTIFLQESCGQNQPPPE